MKTTTYFLIFLSLLLLVFSCKKEEEIPFDGNLQGRVYNSATREPLEGVSVRVRQKGSAGVLESVITTREGLFTLENLTTAEYIIEFSRPGFRFTEEQVNLRAGMVSGLSLYLEPFGAVLDVSPVFLDFKQNLSILAVDIRTLTDSKLLWSIAEEISWVTVGQLSGTLNAKSESQSVPLRVDRTGLNPGRHSQGLVVVSNGGSRNVNLAITVGDDNLPLLQVNELFVDLNNDQNTHTIEVRNAGRETLNWSVVEGIDWLSVTPTSSSLNAGATSNLTLLVNRSGLTDGTYTSYLDIQSNGGTAKILLNVHVGTNITNVTATQFATNVSETFATLNGIVAINESQSNVSFEYGTSTSYGSEVAALQNPLSGAGLVNVNANLIGLQPNTTYHYRLKVQNAGGTTFGRDVIFKTSNPPTMDNLTAEYFLESPERRVQWWNGLEEQWKKAFNSVLGKYDITNIPSDVEIVGLFERTEITFNYIQINNLKGISNLTNLKKLDLGNNQINSLEEVGNLKKLISLNCSYSNITSLEPLRNLNNLQELDCGGNFNLVEFEPISNLSSLLDLKIYSTKIGSLEKLVNLINLQYLNCNFTQINNINSIKNFQNLKELYCGLNQINSLEPIKNLTKLQKLSCNDNQINSLASISNLTNLQYINFGYNQINSLVPFTNLTNLEELHGDSNQIISLWGFENLRKLKSGYVELQDGNNIPFAEIRRIEVLLGITIN